MRLHAVLPAEALLEHDALVAEHLQEARGEGEERRKVWQVWQGVKHVGAKQPNTTLNTCRGQGGERGQEVWQVLRVVKQPGAQRPACTSKYDALVSLSTW